MLIKKAEDIAVSYILVKLQNHCCPRLGAQACREYVVLKESRAANITDSGPRTNRCVIPTFGAGVDSVRRYDVTWKRLSGEWVRYNSVVMGKVPGLHLQRRPREGEGLVDENFSPVRMISEVKKRLVAAVINARDTNRPSDPEKSPPDRVGRTSVALIEW